MENKEQNLTYLPNHQWTKPLRKNLIYLLRRKIHFSLNVKNIYNLGIVLNDINLRFAAGIYLFEKYDGRHTVEEIREIVENETDTLINEDK